MFGGVAFDEEFIEVGAEVGQSPFFQVGGVGDIVTGGGEFLPGFLGRGDIPDLLEGFEVDGEGVVGIALADAAAVDIRVEGGEAVDVLPNAEAIGVEEMGTVSVDGDAFGMLREAVAGDVGAFFDDEAALAGISQLPSEDCAKETGTDDEEIIHRASGRRWRVGSGGGEWGFERRRDRGAAFRADRAGGVGAEVVATVAARGCSEAVLLKATKGLLNAGEVQT